MGRKARRGRILERMRSVMLILSRRIRVSCRRRYESRQRPLGFPSQLMGVRIMKVRVLVVRGIGTRIRCGRQRWFRRSGAPMVTRVVTGFREGCILEWLLCASLCRGGRAAHDCDCRGCRAWVNWCGLSRSQYVFYGSLEKVSDGHWLRRCWKEDAKLLMNGISRECGGSIQERQRVTTVALLFSQKKGVHNLSAPETHEDNARCKTDLRF
jgi:hypothetical protein